MLNEASDYGSAFSRGLRVDLSGLVILFTLLLESEGATWGDVVRTTCYLRDIERDYAAFNEERSRFFAEQALDLLLASTGIQAILCRAELRGD